MLITRDAPGVVQLRRVLGGYERWRAVHRTSGLFVAAGFAHGLLDGTPFGGAPVPRDGAVANIRFWPPSGRPALGRLGIARHARSCRGAPLLSRAAWMRQPGTAVAVVLNPARAGRCMTALHRASEWSG